VKNKTLFALIFGGALLVSGASAFAAGSSSTSVNAGGAGAAGGKPAAPVQLVVVLCPGSTYYGCYVPATTAPVTNSTAETALGVATVSNQNQGGKPLP